MPNIRVDTTYTVIDGSEVVFTAPCNCSEIDGLKVYYPEGSKEFTFKDAHSNALTGIGEAFAKGALVKVILDVTNSFAYIQNADTNSYIETTKADIQTQLNGKVPTTRKINNKALSSNITLTASDVGAAPSYTYSTTDLTAGTSSLTTGKMYLVYE